MRALPTSLLALLPLGLAAACSGGEEPAAAAAPSLTATRPYDPALRPAIDALERGDPTAAARALEGANDARVEVKLLRARLWLVDGDPVRALAAVEEARALGPEDDRVFATACELYAALGRRSAAEDEVRQGWKVAGRTPALERARGVLNLTVPGAAETGLACLERAHARDPGLPFLDGPLVQAYVLAARAELTREEPGAALRHGTAALELAPDWLDAKEVAAEARAALLDFDGALALYAELEDAGRDLREERALLHQRAATYALLGQGDEDAGQGRGVAVRHYLAARALGLSDEELGFGVTVLREEATAELDRGIARYEDGDLAGAERAFRRALELAPDDLEARNHLAVVAFRSGRYREAAEGWAEVLLAMRTRDLPLVDPLPLNLARAWRMAGEPEVALTVVEDFCERDPDGPWADEARSMRERLRSELGAAEPTGPTGH